MEPGPAGAFKNCYATAGRRLDDARVESLDRIVGLLWQREWES
jgi:hypothetical protein